jgi:hypothetical protein
VVSDDGYRALEQLEQQLKENDQPELMMDVAASQIDLDLPGECGEVNQCKIRVYLDEETRAGLFHFVGHASRDDSLVYTEPTMVRLIAL